MKKLLPYLVLFFSVHCFSQSIHFEDESRKQETIELNSAFQGKTYPVWKLEKEFFYLDSFLGLNAFPQDAQTSKNNGALDIDIGTVTWSADQTIYFIKSEKAISEVYAYQSGKITHLPTKEQVPFRRRACVWETEDTVWVYGGEYVNPERGNTVFLNDMWCWLKKEKIWKKIEYSGEPPALSRATTWTVDEGLKMYGGFANEPLSEFWNFDFSKNSWHKTEFKEESVSPGKRFDAHSWITKEGLWLWGGRNFTRNKEPFFWLFETGTSTWNKVFSNIFTDPDDCNAVVAESQNLLFIMHQNMEVLKATVKPTQLK